MAWVMIRLFHLRFLFLRCLRLSRLLNLLVEIPYCMPMSFHRHWPSRLFPSLQCLLWSSPSHQRNLPFPWAIFTHMPSRRNPSPWVVFSILLLCQPSSFEYGLGHWVGFLTPVRCVMLCGRQIWLGLPPLPSLIWMDGQPHDLCDYSSCLC